MLKKLIKFCAVFAVFLFIAGVFAYLTISYSIKNEDIIVVPELTGRDVVNVLEQLSDLGLNTKVAGYEYTSAIPKNFVISQDPEPGTLIKEGRDVRIIFSKGPRSLFMPALTNMNYLNAGLLLDESGLDEGNLSYTHNDNYPKNQIIAQFPTEGTEIAKGMPVDLLISNGKKKLNFVMADLTELSIDDAVFYLEKNRLVIGEIKSVISDKVPGNTIISHDPPFGHKVTEGRKVKLQINRTSSSGKKQFVHNPGTRLFRHRLEAGFLKKHIKAQLSCYGHIDEVFNDFVKPGEDIWVLVPYNTQATVFLYEDNELIKTKFFE